jgi:hypothetical protein
MSEDRDKPVRCPACSSMQIENLATGFLRHGDVMLTCSKCGCCFRPGKAQRRQIVLCLIAMLAIWLAIGLLAERTLLEVGVPRLEQPHP